MTNLHLSWICVIVAWFTCIVRAQDVCDLVGRPNGTNFFGVKCLVFESVPKDYNSAERTCGNIGGKLMKVTDKGTNNYLRDRFQILNWNAAFIGLKKSSTYWRWLDDGSILQHQGCFTDDASTPSLNKRVLRKQNLNSYMDCYKECDRLHPNDMYFGVKIITSEKTESFSGTSCFCGNTFDRLSQSDGCNTPCDGKEHAILCGGDNKYDVYYKPGAVSDWAYNQPNNYDNNQYCGVLDGIHSTGKMADQNCLENRPFVCGAPYQAVASDCRNASSSRNLVFNLNNTLCIQFRVDKSVNWYQADTECRSIGSNWELLRIPDFKTFKILEAVFIEIVKDSTYKNYFWAGFGKHNWFWRDGSRPIYTNWGWQEPKSTKDCAKLSKISHNNWVWQSTDCNNEKNRFVCEIAKPTTTTSTTTTTTTPTPTTTPTTTTKPPTTTTKPQTTTTKPLPTTTKTIVTTPKAIIASTDKQVSTKTTTVKPTSTQNNPGTTTSQQTTSTTTEFVVTGPTGGGDPNLGASTDNQDLTKFQIVLIFCLVLLAVSIIVAMALFIYYKHKHGKQQVAPTKYETGKDPSGLPPPQTDARGLTMADSNSMYANGYSNGNTARNGYGRRIMIEN